MTGPFEVTFIQVHDAQVAYRYAQEVHDGDLAGLDLAIEEATTFLKRDGGTIDFPIPYPAHVERFVYLHAERFDGIIEGTVIERDAQRGEVELRFDVFLDDLRYTSGEAMNARTIRARCETFGREVHHFR